MQILSIPKECFSSIISIYLSPNAVFGKGIFQLSGQKSCLFTTSIWQGAKNTCCLQLLVFLKTWRSKVFSKGHCHQDLNAFCLNGHNSVLMNIIKIWSKADSYNCKFMVTYLLRRGWKKETVKTKVIWKSSLNFTFANYRRFSIFSLVELFLSFSCHFFNNAL